MNKILPPVLAALVAVLMLLVDHFCPVLQIIAPPYQPGGAVLLVLGILLTLLARLQFARAKTNIYTFSEPGSLQTGGVFALSRNPMYLGFTMALLGGAVMLGSLSALLLSAVFALITDRWYIAYEERAMRHKFGAAFDAYAASTRRWC
ncbi:MAG: isoprenylcysteine carboxylmethyltransferase family protein [Rhodoferax sp.]|nr:isoprenylcysteine carboxylmethyltransferase family protein [Rhodoferax sp.]MDP3653079.1 isoprenylcysteine carboxylmethyltransferase family protein [Rhodoferax sp.]